MAEYTVRGVYSGTGRRRTKKYFAASEAEAIDMAKADDIEVEQIEKTAIIPPEISLREAAGELGIEINSDTDAHELELKLRVAFAKKNPPSPGNLRTAEQLQISLPEHTSRPGFYGHVFQTLVDEGRDKDLAAWFAYRITKSIAKRGEDLPGAEGPNAPAIRSVAAELFTDPKAMKSIKNYDELRWFGIWVAPDGTEVQGGSENTIAYRKAIKLLRPALGLSEHKRSVKGGGSGATPSKGAGCVSALAVLTLGCIALYICC